MIRFQTGATSIMKAKNLQLMDKIIRVQVYINKMICNLFKKNKEVRVFQIMGMKSNKNK